MMSNQQVVTEIFQKLQQSHKNRILYPYEKRIEQLDQLKKAFQEMRETLKNAIYSDIGRNKQASELLEIDTIISFINHHLSNLKSYMKDKYCDPTILFVPSICKIQYEPLGVALIISSWNYPLFTSIKPLVSCICAGNCAILKPSELGPSSSQALQNIVDKYLDRNCFQVIQGDVEIAKILTAQKFDIICFTGSSEKGKLVSQAAAKNLIPCIMELGGKCPVIIDKSADLDYAAYKTMFGKFQNSGQTCIGVDYILVHESLLDKTVDSLLFHLHKQYGISKNDPKSFGFNDLVGKLINEQAVERVSECIQNSGGEVIIGGLKTVNSKERYICPTIIKNPSLDSKLMKEEIFGPVLPILTFKNSDDLMENYLKKQEKPLSIYYFGNQYSSILKRILNETSSGNVTVNDTLFQTVEPEIGFGGVGQSGSGRFGGYEGFKQFSNPKSVVIKNQLNIWPYNYFCPPYTPGKQKFILFLSSLVTLKQNKILGFVFKVAFIFITYMLAFGKWGEGKFRKQTVQKLISWLKQYYKV